MSAHDDGPSVGGDGNTLPGPPEATASAAAFVRAMRVLRQWTGLTYRQLQSRAQRSGDVLPHSTLAAVLGRNTLPREELVRAFVRACGGSERAIEEWVTVRREIAVRLDRAAADLVDPDPNPNPGSAAKPDPGSVAAGSDVMRESGIAVGTGLEPEGGTGPDGGAETEPESGAESRAGAEADAGSGAEPEAGRSGAEPGPRKSGAESGAGGSGAEPEAGSSAGSERDRGDGPAAEVSVLEPTTADDEAPLAAASSPSAAPTQRPLAAATALQDRYRWTGVHRRDPAVDVPRPAGLRWLIPPIMYRTGWAARVLSGALVLILVLISVGVVVRSLRPDPGDGYVPGVEGAEALDDAPEEGDDVPVGDDGSTPSPAPNAPAPSAAAPAVNARPTASGSPTTVARTSSRPATTAARPPAQPGDPPAQPAKPKPAATPYLTASVSTSCQGGGSWTISISGTLHNESVGYDPHGSVDHQDGTIYGYPISGDGSTSFSGTVPKAFGPDHELTSASAGWRLDAYVNGDMITGDRISTSGTVSRPAGC